LAGSGGRGGGGSSPPPPGGGGSGDINALLKESPVSNSVIAFIILTFIDLILKLNYL
jgi:hypothetical protein